MNINLYTLKNLLYKMSKKLSLKQFLMKSGRFQKTYGCVEAIKQGRVTINNKVMLNSSHFFNPKKDLVKLDNEKLRTVSKLYFIMNKPAGYLSQKSNEEKNIYDLLNNISLPRESVLSLHAVGRLDKDTEGLLILTNDGKLSNIIMEPKSEIIKKYFGILENRVDKGKIKELEKGIEIEVDDVKYKTKPCKIKIVGEKEIYISVSEGKKRQIRLMFESIGNKAVYLRRVSIAGLQLGKLNVGEIKQITREEIMEKLEF